MKHRTLTILILCLALLLAACQQVTPPPTDGTTLPSSEPAAPTSPTAVTTEPSEAPTQPSEPILYDPELTPSDWQPAFQPMSYEDYFAVDRLFSWTPTVWYVAKAEGYTTAQLDQSHGRLAVMGVTADGKEGCHIVPGWEELQDYTILAADGVYGYLYNDTSILRVHLLTGEKQVIREFDRVFCNFPSTAKYSGMRAHGNHILVYYVEEDGILSAYRMYLPTLQEDLIGKNLPIDWDDNSFFCNSRSYNSAHDDIYWTDINPEMLARLRKELADPNSPYKEIEPSTWENEFDLSTIGPMVIHKIQQDTDIHAWIKGIYHQADGSATQTTGIIDTCWYGSGYGHDHFDPQYYDDIKPQWIMSDPVSLPNLVIPEGAVQIYESGDWTRTWEIEHLEIGDGESKLYAYRYDTDLHRRIYTPLASQSVREYIALKDSIFCITQENTLIQVMPDGTTHVIYTAQNGALHDMEYGYGRLYFLDGDILMEIDIPAGTCMKLMKVEHFSRMYLDEARVMYIDVVGGLSVDGLVCDFNQRTMKSQFRL